LEECLAIYSNNGKKNRFIIPSAEPELKEYSINNHMIKPGDRVDGIYLVKSGEFEKFLYQDSPSRRETGK